MDRDSTEGGDPRRSFELLWRRQEPGRRGPKQRLSTDALVEAAIALADAEGVQAVSMRRVAEAIGVSPMTLYTYVPSKAELLDLMFDRVMGETAEPDASHAGWRARLAFISRERWALSQRHPWLLDLASHRPPFGPNMLRRAEVALEAFDGMGLEEADVALAAQALQNYVVGALYAARQSRELETRSGMTDAQWFEQVQELLARRVDPKEYPAMRRLGVAKLESRTPAELDQRFEFGLERMLDGLETFIRQRQQRGLAAERRAD